MSNATREPIHPLAELTHRPGLVVFGASGFLGNVLLARAGTALPMPLRAVSRRGPPRAASAHSVTWHVADMNDSCSLDRVLGTGDIVVNLAYEPCADAALNLRMASQLVDACLRAQVARIVHCSTAVVVGGTTVRRITEATVCEPATAYERSKWAVERCIVEAGVQGLDAVIIRPTAIIGMGSMNLAALAGSLQQRRHTLNYLRASLFQDRPMHLIPASYVADAILFLARQEGRYDGDVFIASSDSDDGNDYLSVERELANAMKLPTRKLRLLPIPSFVLSALLALRGRSDTGIARTYDGSRLRSLGLEPAETVLEAVRAFGASFS